VYDQNKVIIAVIVVIIVFIGIILGVTFGIKESTTIKSCQEQCNSLLTGTPVTEFEFQQAILGYLKDPASSPYGSVINCWDVSQVCFHPYIILICIVLFFF
jgi:hypothetical protein